MSGPSPVMRPASANSSLIAYLLSLAEGLVTAVHLQAAGSSKISDWPGSIFLDSDFNVSGLANYAIPL